MLEVCLDNVPDFAEKVAPPNLPQIAVRSRVGHLTKRNKTYKNKCKSIPKLTDVLIDFVMIG